MSPLKIGLKILRALRPRRNAIFKNFEYSAPSMIENKMSVFGFPIEKILFQISLLPTPQICSPSILLSEKGKIRKFIASLPASSCDRNKGEIPRDFFRLFRPRWHVFEIRGLYLTRHVVVVEGRFSLVSMENFGKVVEIKKHFLP